jgi:4'-phosphopantetheinyl transferase
MHLVIPPQIKKEELHVWWANLRDFDLAVPALWSVLSHWERARAERFRLPRDKDDFIIRHAMLRMLLGAYVGCYPSRLDLPMGPNGKPEPRHHFEIEGIHFNLSHSGDVALFGFTGACPIGLDVEQIQPVPHCERIASETFSHAETKSLMALPRELRFGRFFDLWTRKEALLKAVGDGLRPGRTARPRIVPRPDGSRPSHPSPPAEAPGEWHVHSFSPREGYVAAVAFQKPDLDLICRTTPAFFSLELRDRVRTDLRARTGT